MVDILIAIGILGGLGLIFGLVLAAASKVFYVETDPRLDQLNECLPGANCGGCGYPGCGGYAEAVLKGDAAIGLCASGGTECKGHTAGNTQPHNCRRLKCPHFRLRNRCTNFHDFCPDCGNGKFRRGALAPIFQSNNGEPQVFT